MSSLAEEDTSSFPLNLLHQNGTKELRAADLAALRAAGTPLSLITSSQLSNHKVEQGSLL